MSYVKIKEKTVRVFEIENEFIWRNSELEYVRAISNEQDHLIIQLNLADEYGELNIRVCNKGFLAEFPHIAGRCYGILCGVAALACDYISWDGYEFVDDFGLDKFFDGLAKTLEDL